jgi:replication factor C large subunit
LWSEKYRPTSIEDLVGNEEARSKLASWLAKWKPGSRAVMLVGPPGTGKTTSIHLLASKNRLNLVELNASDSRTKEKLARKLGEALSSSSLMDERTLVFLDEVDGLSGRKDYGAIEYIKAAVKASVNPVAMAANDPGSDQVKKLSSACTVIPFRPASEEEVIAHLARISKAERAEPSDGRLSAIARASGGDVRYAINALQSGEAGAKDLGMTAAQSVDGFFTAPDVESAVASLRAYPDQPWDKLRDVFNAVVKAKLDPGRRADAMEVLSRADIVMGRIVKGKSWRLLRYLDATLASELRPALKGGQARYTRDAVPWPLLLRIWNDSRKVKEISGLVGRRTHIGPKGSAVSDFPFLMAMCASKEFEAEFAATLELDEPSVKFVEKEAARHAPRKSASRSR